jgi:hypothetical protein
MFDREGLADGTGTGHSSGVLPPSRAILVCGEEFSPAERNLVTLLDFFGIPWRTSRPGELAEMADSMHAAAGGYCVLSIAPSLAESLKSVTAQNANLPPWLQNAHSVYVFGFQDTPRCLELLRYLTAARDTRIQNSGVSEAGVSVTRDFPDLCGPMAGLQMPIKVAEMDSCFGFPAKNDSWPSIISATHGEMFVSATRDGVPFFLSAGSEIIDINAPASKFFDVKDSFSSAVPLVMYLKWAFAHLCGNRAETRCCLIVDDPPLKSRYGFLHFEKALELMDSHDFAMSIAFIPWNWRRTDPKTVRVFQRRADRLSLCVHGCDHTAGEFATRSTGTLNRKIKTAVQRMQGLSQATSLQHDQIMVFPQGAFSPEVGRALKLNGFVAAVNTEVAPSGGARNDTLVSNLWNTANMAYGSFPIFTRRYLTHGVENFAFDALLGKPCLMVAHHEVFKGGACELMEFIRKLNSLNWNLKWCSLGNVISRSFKVCQSSAGVLSVQMFAEHLILENLSTEAGAFAVTKHEKDPDSVKAILINGQPADHRYLENQLQFELTVPAGGRAEIRISYLDNLEIEPLNEGLGYRLKIGARRHLSELRDNYVSQNDFLFAAATRVKRLLS